MWLFRFGGVPATFRSRAIGPAMEDQSRHLPRQRWRIYARLRRQRPVGPQYDRFFYFAAAGPGDIPVFCTALSVLHGLLNGLLQ